MIYAGAIFDQEGIANLGKNLALARLPAGGYVLSGTHNVALTQDELYNLSLALGRLSEVTSDQAAARPAP